MDYYQVKFEHKGKTVYGIAHPYGDNAKKLAKKGLIEVDEAVTGELYTVDKRLLIDIPTGSDYDHKTRRFKDDEFDNYVADARDAAEALSKTIKGCKPGKLFFMPVADGCAFYVVTKVTKTRCTVAWRGFQGDRWVDRILGAGGTFPLGIIAPLIGREEAMQKLFAKEV